ncbi:hypothetical protein SteCoe_27905 [Stentor coeruleus]|uniref:MORN repeat protein n=1 Tax=Stentor coeruleus TaxID=5963 RepID=A0A1R2B9F3_9CILI|nr:hypothetical protein SteCoe_27905 [Stentor coeruleus]
MGNTNSALCFQCMARIDNEIKGTILTPMLIKETLSTESNFPDNTIVLIQSNWKGFIQKKRYQFLKKLTLSSSFFPQMDIFETLSNSPITKREDHKHIYISGTVYEGQWLGGFRHGIGKVQWPDGSCYEGEWSYGYPYGKGEFTHSDGEVFKGKWINPYSTAKHHSPDTKEKNGYIWLSSKPQLHRFKFCAHQRNLDMIKKSVETFTKQLLEDKDIIENALEQIQDNFTEICIDGIKYKGNFEDNKKNGLGLSKWGNGDEYEGYWENDYQHGLGVDNWIDGSRYFGYYVEGRKEGIGEYNWEDGTIYRGEWVNNKFHGIGEHMWSDGRKYVGQWQDGLMHGFGVYYWTNGNRYEGGWKHGKKHGVGISITSGGIETKDQWEYGKIIKID